MSAWLVLAEYASSNMTLWWQLGPASPAPRHCGDKRLTCVAPTSAVRLTPTGTTLTSKRTTEGFASSASPAFA